MANKVKFGFKNCYYAPITISAGGAVTYGSPVKLDGAVSMSLSASGDTTEFYADDSLYFSDVNNNGYEGTLELALIPDHFKIACLGAVKDTNNVLVESSTKVNTPFALLCEFTGDEKERKFVFYNCMASRPDVASTTKGASIEVQPETLNLTIRPNADGVVKAETGADTSAGVDSAWYNSVYTTTASL